MAGSTTRDVGTGVRIYKVVNLLYKKKQLGNQRSIFQCGGMTGLIKVSGNGLPVIK